MSPNAPIGIFDSGLGGLTVAKQICNRLPGENTIYLGDQIHIPYGEREPEEIRGFALGITDFLFKQGSKLVIMACNMSDATSLDAARAAFPQTRVLGVIRAGARAAARATSNGRIGVLATTGTVRSGAYGREIRAIDRSLEVFEQPCPRFVPLVEGGQSHSPEALDAVREYVMPLLKEGCRTLVLGCTHYPFLTDAIESVAGPEVTIIDPAEETAIEAHAILMDAGEMNPARTEPARVYYTSGSPEAFAKLGGRFIGRPIHTVQTVTWGSELGAMEWQEKMAAQMTNSGR